MSTHALPKETVRVWDPLVRLSHWMVAAAFLLAYFLAEEALQLHVWLGYLVGILVLIRIAWGFFGTRHARFTDFLPAPAVLKGYIQGLFRGDEPRFLGHNPLGGIMVVLLLAALALTTLTGIMLYGAEDHRGPLGSWYAQQTVAPQPPAYAATEAGERHESEHPGGEAEQLEIWHDLAADLTLFLVGLHVAGVLFTSRRHKENLVRAMFSGRKRVP
ncbi:cytochrome b/b6 domain-containing protein [Thiohalorhabdus sp. Cl-TMA]|uniref:Cytochrome b/b6 domain-containing protein n=1 Tax=Thiohalorhabdus methylotrophus TaxID=3242694 RepID=A0ABV4TV24_9GAMM